MLRSLVSKIIEMKSSLLSIFLLFVAASSFGQIRYEKGYYIDNDNRKTECLIRNDDWDNNPSEFKFKLENSDIIERGTIVSVKEFCIYGFSKYIRADVKIDRSSNDLDKLTFGSGPIWSSETLFLKALVEGKASLYSFNEGTLNRFFYSVTDTSVNQLIFKKYLTDNLNVAQNNTYKQQLVNDVRCVDARPGSTENIMYTRNALEKYFLNYNRSSGDTIIVKKSNKIKRDLFNLKIASGLNLSAISIRCADNSKNLSFNNNLSFRLGVESEFILPFNMNKWSIVIEPTYQYFTAEKAHDNDISSVNLRSVEFPIGIRCYFFLDKGIKGYLNGFYISNFSLNFKSNIVYNHSNTLDIAPRNSFAFGGGIEYKRISAEIRYYTNRQLSDYMNWTINYNRFSFIIGYKLMKTKQQ